MYHLQRDAQGQLVTRLARTHPQLPALRSADPPLPLPSPPPSALLALLRPLGPLLPPHPPHFPPSLGYCDRICQPWKLLLESCYRNPPVRMFRGLQCDSALAHARQRQELSTKPPCISQETRATPEGGGESHPAPVCVTLASKRKRVFHEELMKLGPGGHQPSRASAMPHGQRRVGPARPWSATRPHSPEQADVQVGGAAPSWVLDDNLPPLASPQSLLVLAQPVWLSG